MLTRYNYKEKLKVECLVEVHLNFCGKCIGIFLKVKICLNSRKFGGSPFSISNKVCNVSKYFLLVKMFLDIDFVKFILPKLSCSLV
jgi:hypothetical protein